MEGNIKPPKLLILKTAFCSGLQISLCSKEFCEHSLIFIIPSDNHTFLGAIPVSLEEILGLFKNCDAANALL